MRILYLLGAHYQTHYCMTIGMHTNKPRYKVQWDMCTGLLATFQQCVHCLLASHHRIAMKMFHWKNFTVTNQVVKIGSCPLQTKGNIMYML